MAACQSSMCEEISFLPRNIVFQKGGHFQMFHIERNIFFSWILIAQGNGRNQRFYWCMRLLQFLEIRLWPFMQVVALGGLKFYCSQQYREKWSQTGKRSFLEMFYSKQSVYFCSALWSFQEVVLRRGFVILENLFLQVVAV